MLSDQCDSCACSCTEKRLIDPETLVVDSKSGTSGAGRKADLSIAFCEVNEGFKAYGIAAHRHTPEIEQEISKLAGKEIAVNFTPHLVPIDRGILTTAYGRLKARLMAKWCRRSIARHIVMSSLSMCLRTAYCPTPNLCAAAITA